MPLDKAIRSGKEHRKLYRGAKRVSRCCRPGGTCPYCIGNRTYRGRRERHTADDAMREYEDE